MLWHSPPPVLQEWIQEVPTPPGRSGSHSTQNHSDFPQGLFPWWHRWGKWERRESSVSDRMAANFLSKISKEVNIGPDSERFNLSRRLWMEQCKETLSLSTPSSSGGWCIVTHVFQDLSALLVFTWGFIVWPQKEGKWVVHKPWISVTCSLDHRYCPPNYIQWWGSLGTEQTMAALASEWLKWHLLTWGDTEIIPALRNLSLSILHANKAASSIDARADMHVSCCWCGACISFSPHAFGHN